MTDDHQLELFDPRLYQSEQVVREWGKIMWFPEKQHEDEFEQLEIELFLKDLEEEPKDLKQAA